jgi:hypothetical protein
MAAREILFAVIESSYGTPKASPTLGTDSFYLRLDQGNAFTVEATPVQLSIPYGGGYSVEADTVSDIVGVKGNFAFNLYPGIWSSILLNWAITPVNSARTAPWTTTDAAGVMPIGDFASLSFYHAILSQDGSTYVRTRYAGMKCDSWKISASETGQGRIFTLTGSMTGIKPVGNAWDSSSDPTATEFPLPAETSYPFSPFTLGHLATGTGTATIGSSGGTNRAGTLISLTASGTNKFAPNYYTSRFLSTYRFTGRSVTADATILFKNSPDDRAAFRALTPQTVSLKIDNGTNSVDLAFQTKNLISNWERQLPVDGQYLQAISLRNRFEASAATDLAVTVA